VVCAWQARNAPSLGASRLSICRNRELGHPRRHALHRFGPIMCCAAACFQCVPHMVFVLLVQVPQQEAQAVHRACGAVGQVRTSVPLLGRKPVLLYLLWHSGTGSGCGLLNVNDHQQLCRHALCYRVRLSKPYGKATRLTPVNQGPFKLTMLRVSLRSNCCNCPHVAQDLWSAP